MRLLLASGCLPDRAGQAAQVQLHLTLDELMDMPGAGNAASTWLARHLAHQPARRQATATAATLARPARPSATRTPASRAAPISPALTTPARPTRTRTLPLQASPAQAASPPVVRPRPARPRRADRPRPPRPVRPPPAPRRPPRRRPRRPARLARRQGRRRLHPATRRSPPWSAATSTATPSPALVTDWLAGDLANLVTSTDPVPAPGPRCACDEHPARPRAVTPRPPQALPTGPARPPGHASATPLTPGGLARLQDTLLRYAVASCRAPPGSPPTCGPSSPADSSPPPASRWTSASPPSRYRPTSAGPSSSGTGTAPSRAAPPRPSAVMCIT